LARGGHDCQREDIPAGSSLFFRQPWPGGFRNSSGSFANLLASSRVRSFTQALLKRVLLKRVLGPPALLKRGLVGSGFAQFIGCAAQPVRATALAIAVRNDRMALPSPASDGSHLLHGVGGGCRWWDGRNSWPFHGNAQSCHRVATQLLATGWQFQGRAGRDERTRKLNQFNPTQHQGGRVQWFTKPLLYR